MMYNNFYQSGWNMMNGQWLMMSTGWSLPVFLIGLLLIGWSLVWKGMALWKSARRAHKVWFVALLVTNTLGILDILYLYVFSKKSKAVK